MAGERKTEGGREQRGQLVTGTEEKDDMRLRNESGSMRKVRKMGTWLKRGGERAQPNLIFTQLYHITLHVWKLGLQKDSSNERQE